MTRVCSIFSQTLQLISRLEFESAVRKQGAERHARGFSCWGQFIAMLFCQRGHAKSLREICGGLAASEGKLRHLGLPQAPARSTLAYANQHRPWQLYRTGFDQLLAKCQSNLRESCTLATGRISPACAAGLRTLLRLADDQYRAVPTTGRMHPVSRSICSLVMAEAPPLHRV